MNLLEARIIAATRRLRDSAPGLFNPLYQAARFGWLAFKRSRVIARGLVGRWFARAGQASQIHLSWTADPDTSVTVCWWTPASGRNAVVSYRRPGEDAWQSRTATSLRSPGIHGYLHRATLAGLTPDATIEYRVSNDPGYTTPFSDIHVTRTAPAGEDTAIDFAFVCDTGIHGRRDGNADGTLRIIDAIREQAPLLILAAGDYAYANSDTRFDAVGDAVDAWFEQMQPIASRHPVLAQYGNHEIFLVERFDDWAERFCHPPGPGEDRDYSLTIGPVHIVSLFVPNPPYPTDEQLEWLTRELEQARERDVPWLIVFQHEPIFGHGSSHPAVPEIREKLLPIFQAYSVDLHLSGHDQNYERSFPVTGSIHDYRCATREKTAYRKGEGVVYLKCSPGGKRSEIGHNFSQLQHPLPDVIAVHDDTAHHYAYIRATKDVLAVEAYSLLDKGPARTLDRFSIRATALDDEPA